MSSRNNVPPFVTKPAGRFIWVLAGRVKSVQAGSGFFIIRADNETVRATIGGEFHEGTLDGALARIKNNVERERYRSLFNLTDATVADIRMLGFDESYGIKI